MKKASDIRKVMTVLAIASLFGISACIPISVTKSVGAKPESVKVGKTTVSDVKLESGPPDYTTPDQRFFMYSYYRVGGVFFALAGPYGGNRDDLIWTTPQVHFRLLIEFDDSGVVVNKLLHGCKKQQTDEICDQPASKSIWALIGKLNGDEIAANYEERMAAIYPSPELVPINAAVFRGDTKKLRSLIEQGADPNVSDRHGTTALHIASIYGNQPAAKILLPMIHDLNTGNRWGYTALHYAAEHGHTEILQLLISNGADVKKPNAFGQTPLHAAAQFPNTAPTKLLLAAGADPHMRDADGRLPIDIAKQRQNEQVSRFLNALKQQN